MHPVHMQETRSDNPLVIFIQEHRIHPEFIFVIKKAVLESPVGNDHVGKYQDK
jgi:hypothetical protein